MNNPICPKELCTGCAACYSICPVRCIHMNMDSEGFLFPIIEEEKCINCRKCESICPSFNSYLPNNDLKPDVYACWHKDERIRYLSSSGGAFSALAEVVINENGIVIGAAYDNQMHVKHIAINNKDDLGKLRGSKYVQSDLGNIFLHVEKYIKSGRKVLFSGTPCQIAGLKKFIDNKGIKNNLITCDLLCKGVPSPGLFEKYIKYIEKKMKIKVVNYYFRDKRKGWELPSRVAIFENGEETLMKELNDSYNYGFAKGFTLRKACYNCLYTNTRRVGDVTLGDFWGIGEIAEFNYKTEKGVSLLLVNSRIGEELVSEAIRQNLLFVEKRSLKEAKDKCSKLSYTTPEPLIRDKFFEDYSRLEYEQLAKKYLIDKGLKGLIKKVVPYTWVYHFRKIMTGS